MHLKFTFVIAAVLVVLSFIGCEYKKPKTIVYADSLFIKDSVMVFGNTYQPETVWENLNDTSGKHFEPDYLTALYEQIQLHKIQFLVPPQRYKALDEHLRDLPVLVITGRQFRNEQTGADMPGDFVAGKFIGSHTEAILIPFGDYLDHRNDKYKYEIIDTMPKGNASVGMTKSMIIKALGNPINIIRGENPGCRLEQWTYDFIYKFDGTPEKLKEKKFIYFIDERAVSIKG